MNASQFLPTQYELKLRSKAEAYEKKKQSKFIVTEENQEFVWNHLSQALFSIDYASFHVKALERKGAFPDSDSLVEFANKTEQKFEKFLANLNDDGKVKYKSERSKFEEFVRQFCTFNDDDRKRLFGMADKIEREKFKR